MILTAEQRKNRKDLVAQFMRREISYKTLRDCWLVDDSELPGDPPNAEEALDSIRLILGRLSLLAAEHPQATKEIDELKSEVILMGVSIEEAGANANRP
jgi:hypothetical protein